MYIALALCLIIIVALIIKVILLKKGLREISDGFKSKSTLDTNTPVKVTSMDKDVRECASSINDTLETVRQKYHKYELGDKKMQSDITNLAHDIRTPLTAICGYLSLLKRHDRSPEVERYLDIIEERSLYMKNLTDQLFGYMVVRSDDRKVKLEDVKVNQVLENAIMNYSGSLFECGIEPVIEITENDVIRKLNSANLERVFSNLISNAVKYSEKDLYISLTDDGVITFENKAPGLSRIDVENMFDRFSTVNTGRESTGVGLSIVRTFVEDMGGTISAEYSDGKLRIVICFPA